MSPNQIRTCTSPQPAIAGTVNGFTSPTVLQLASHSITSTIIGRFTIGEYEPLVISLPCIGPRGTRRCELQTASLPRSEGTKYLHLERAGILRKENRCRIESQARCIRLDRTVISEFLRDRIANADGPTRTGVFRHSCSSLHRVRAAKSASYYRGPPDDPEVRLGRVVVRPARPVRSGDRAASLRAAWEWCRCSSSIL